MIYTKCLDSYADIIKQYSDSSFKPGFKEVGVLLYNKMKEANILCFHQKTDLMLSKLEIDEKSIFVKSGLIPIPFDDCFLDFGNNINITAEYNNAKIRILGVYFHDCGISNCSAKIVIFYTENFDSEITFKDISLFGSTRLPIELIDLFKSFFDYKEKVLFTSDVKYLKTKKHGNLYRKIVYVVNRKNISKFKTENPNFEHTHRYEVMGHWRKINPNSIGKNRNGDYLVTGMTWVVSHERGHEDMNVIKKTRIYKPLEISV